MLKLRRLFLARIIADYDCGIGCYTIAVDISGNVFPCHRYSSNPSAIIGTTKDIPIFYRDGITANMYNS